MAVDTRSAVRRPRHPLDYVGDGGTVEIDLNTPGLLSAGGTSGTISLLSASLTTPGCSEFPFPPVMVREHDDLLHSTSGLNTMSSVSTNDASLGGTPRKKHSFIRAVKKIAGKTFGKTKSLTNRRERKLSKQDVRVIFQAIEAAQQPANVVQQCVSQANTSTDSLTAMLGSPTTLSGFPISPPSVIYDDRFLPQLHWKTRKKAQESLTVAMFKLFMKAALFLPYVLIVGFAVFLAPSRLSDVTFSSFFGYVSRPSTDIERFSHHAKVLPCHVGVVCGFMAMCAWRLFRDCPLVGLGINIILASTSCLMWRDFKPIKEEGAELGADDRMTIYKVYSMAVPKVLRDIVFNGLAGIGKPTASDAVEELEHLDGPWNVTLELKGQQQERMRIIVECED